MLNVVSPDDSNWFLQIFYKEMNKDINVKFYYTLFIIKYKRLFKYKKIV